MQRNIQAAEQQQQIFEQQIFGNQSGNPLQVNLGPGQNSFPANHANYRSGSFFCLGFESIEQMTLS